MIRGIDEATMCTLLIIADITVLNLCLPQTATVMTVSIQPRASCLLHSKHLPIILSPTSPIPLTHRNMSLPSSALLLINPPSSPPHLK